MFSKGLLAWLCGVTILTIVDAQSCPQYTCDNGQCVSYSDRCDNFNDCSDGSDERACSFFIGCSHTFPCKSGGCTTFLSGRCDSFSECSDGSDETNCGYTTVTLSSGTTIIIVGVVIGVFIFVVAISVCICVTILCSLFCCTGVAEAAAGSSLRGNRNIHTNVRPASAPIMTTTSTTTTEVATDKPAYPVGSTLQQEPPPSYADVSAYPQQPTGAYPLQPVCAYPQLLAIESEV